MFPYDFFHYLQLQTASNKDLNNNNSVARDPEWQAFAVETTVRQLREQIACKYPQEAFKIPPPAVNPRKALRHGMPAETPDQFGLKEERKLSYPDVIGYIPQEPNILPESPLDCIWKQYLEIGEERWHQMLENAWIDPQYFQKTDTMPKILTRVKTESPLTQIWKQYLEVGQERWHQMLENAWLDSE